MKTEQPLLITTVRHQGQTLDIIPANRAITYDGMLADETMKILGISNAEVPGHSDIPVMCEGIALCKTFNQTASYTPGMDIAVRSSYGEVGPVNDAASIFGKCLDTASGAGLLIRVKLNT